MNREQRAKLRAQIDAKKAAAAGFKGPAAHGDVETLPPEKPPTCILCICGHKDQNRLCAHCRAESKKSREIRRKQRTKNFKEDQVYRLPRGSEKTLFWNGENWTGRLMVPCVNQIFASTAPTERECLYGMHEQYEKHLAEKTNKKKLLAKEVKAVVDSPLEMEKAQDGS